MLSVGCDSNISSVFKAFAMLFGFSHWCATQWSVCNLSGVLSFISVFSLWNVNYDNILVYAQVESKPRCLYTTPWGFCSQKAMELASALLEQPHQRYKITLPQSFGSYRHPWQTDITNRVEKIEKSKGKKQGMTSTLWVLHLFSYLKSEIEGFWISFYLHHTAQFQVSGCTEVRSGDPKGLVVFQNLMFFSNLIAAIYHAFCAGFTVTVSCLKKKGGCRGGCVFTHYYWEPEDTTVFCCC